MLGGCVAGGTSFAHDPGPHGDPDLRPQAPGVQSDGKNGSVIVTWVYPEADGYSAVVFRRAGRGEFTQVSPVLKSTRFADTVPGPGNYQYALKFYLAGMGGSEMGTSTSVNLK